MSTAPDMLLAPVIVEFPRYGNRAHRATVTGLRAWVHFSRRVLGGRGVGLACVAAAKIAATDRSVTFRLASGGHFTVDATDRYWVLPLLLDAAYEPDLDWFLTGALRADDVFLDCGANAGVWSVAASSVIVDPSRVVAVEAGRTAFGRLSRNAANNPGRFTTVNRALSDQSNCLLEFFSDDADTASASLVRAMATDGARSEQVTTIALGDLLPPHDCSEALTFLKLDIEGMEETVIASCPPEAFDNVIVMYEDHGRDPTSAVTAMLLTHGFSIWLLLDEGHAVPVIETDQVRPYKVDPHKGYNLIAARPGTRGEARVAQTISSSAIT